MSKPFFPEKSFVTKHNIYLRVTNICVGMNSHFGCRRLHESKTFQIRKVAICFPQHPSKNTFRKIRGILLCYPLCNFSVI